MNISVHVCIPGPGAYGLQQKPPPHSHGRDLSIPRVREENKRTFLSPLLWLLGPGAKYPLYPLSWALSGGAVLTKMLVSVKRCCKHAVRHVPIGGTGAGLRQAAAGSPNPTDGG